MLRYPKAKRRKVKDLPTLRSEHRGAQKRVPAGKTGLWPMNTGFVRLLYRRECSTRMSRLPAGGTARLLAQARGLGRLAHSIARGRFAAIMAVFAQPGLQLQNPRAQRIDLRLHPAHERIDRIGTLIIDNLELLTRNHN